MAKPIRIVRAPHDDKYFASSRVTPQDRTLSWEARGVLWYLLSRPDTWELQPNDLQQGCGRDKVYKILKELIDHRYIERVEERNDKAKFVGLVYRVYEQPYPEKPDTVKTTTKRPRKAKVLPETPDTALPDTENTHTREYRSTENTEKEEEQPLSASSPEEPTPRPRNAWYDAVKAVWGYTASYNGEMAKMLQGISKRKGFLEYNLATPISADDLKDWARWYRSTELHNDPTLNMLQDRMKIQSSITAWQERCRRKAEDNQRREAADREWAAAHPELYNTLLRRQETAVHS